LIWADLRAATDKAITVQASSKQPSDKPSGRAYSCAAKGGFMESEQAVSPYRPEKVEFTSPDELPGVGVLSVDDCARRWAVVHTTYTVCTGLAIGRPAEWRYRNRAYVQPADGIQLMEPGELHANTVQTDIASFRVLMIEPELVERAAKELDAAATPHLRIAQTNSRDHPQLRRALLDLHSSLEKPAPTLERQTLFTTCLRLLLEQAVEDPVRADDKTAARRQVDRARDYVEAHLTEQIPLEDLALAAGFGSRFHLIRAFTNTLGLPPHAYLLSRRIARSRALLRTGIRPARVAAELGFADQSHFSRHFLRAMGVSPGGYARAIGTLTGIDGQGAADAPEGAAQLRSIRRSHLTTRMSG
jgi:AraC-like DNA-binding protein